MNKASETRIKLINWDRGQTDSERFSALILKNAGYSNLDPIHPVGGPDGGKDIVCMRDNGTRWIGAVYFATTEQKSFKVIKDKFAKDLVGAIKNDANGIVFVCNQKLSEMERIELSEMAKDKGLGADIFHIEKLVHILNTPEMYGVRYDFLGIEISKEEELAYLEMANKKAFVSLNQKLDRLYEIMTSEIVGDEAWPLSARSKKEVISAEEEFYEKIWYERHLVLKYRVENGIEDCDKEVFKNAKINAKKLEEKYGAENLGPYSDFEWGMINGKLSALRWVLGEQWDMLDT